MAAKKFAKGFNAKAQRRGEREEWMVVRSNPMYACPDERDVQNFPIYTYIL